jgi:hypothetical protein
VAKFTKSYRKYHVIITHFCRDPQEAARKRTAWGRVLSTEYYRCITVVSIKFLQIWCYPEGVQEVVDTLKSRVILISCMRSFESVFSELLPCKWDYCIQHVSVNPSWRVWQFRTNSKIKFKIHLYLESNHLFERYWSHRVLQCVTLNGYLTLLVQLTTIGTAQGNLVIVVFLCCNQNKPSTTDPRQLEGKWKYYQYCSQAHFTPLSEQRLRSIHEAKLSPEER